MLLVLLATAACMYLVRMPGNGFFRIEAQDDIDIEAALERRFELWSPRKNKLDRVDSNDI